jgi:hypothetical protein
MVHDLEKMDVAVWTWSFGRGHLDSAVWTWRQMDVKKNIYKSVNKINKLFIFIIICKF